ncbi:hypothetical protein KY290_033785 [Solanum tuberosum]|uniref:Auxin-responsive protein n=1 Tax=Solanum tuberosum TaxID=4113 RepID=A0ABQ7U1C2_SOLTU|nr:hypothetical protein KY289_034747 [Solanum tuberosum]KAH0644924.1 hypothetical protein KY284_032808 [Solanum tuberosum]KAH0647801.1 hypothetical protein KY285_033049 [Solanum tuberosum]KAH0740742.1 hypothetical protein KY290_033785 [Solanum tuberosum]
MEGVPIGRKVDIRLYHSYQLLTQNLLQMFSKYQNSGNNSTRFTILYQDREGDWMLAGDVPWNFGNQWLLQNIRGDCSKN